MAALGALRLECVYSRKSETIPEHQLPKNTHNTQAKPVGYSKGDVYAQQCEINGEITADGECVVFMAFK